MTIHVDHCVEILRQRLICTADVSVIWYWWRSDTSPPKLVPKVGLPHTCRNFDKIQKWAFDRW
jgi:hypothetical protein